MQFTDTSERGFQKFITNYLVTEYQFVVTTPAEFVSFVSKPQVLAFRAATQTEA